MKKTVASSKHIQTTATKASTLYRGNDKVLAGVCDGIAQRLDVDAVVARVTCIVLFISTAGIITIPYLVLAFVLPKQPNDNEMLDVHPVSVVSDRYEEVVEAQKPTSTTTPERYGVQADAGHVPPVPPQGDGVNVGQQSTYIPYRHTEVQNGNSESHTNRVLIVITVAVAMTALFIAMANSTIARHPGLEVIDFWPELLIVAGTTLLVCFYDRLSFVVRITGLIFCVELTFALLPFTLGICPLHSLERISFVPVVFCLLGLVCFIDSLIKKRSMSLVIMVLFFGIALIWMLGEVGLVERLLVAASYSRHNITTPLFRGYPGQL